MLSAKFGKLMKKNKKSFFLAKLIQPILYLHSCTYVHFFDHLFSKQELSIANNLLPTILGKSWSSYSFWLANIYISVRKVYSVHCTNNKIVSFTKMFNKTVKWTIAILIESISELYQLLYWSAEHNRMVRINIVGKLPFCNQPLQLIGRDLPSNATTVVNHQMPKPNSMPQKAFQSCIYFLT